jgi:electron transfer flavoprotein beta subunit
VAEELGIPHVAIVTKMQVSPDGKNVTCQREVEGGQVTVEVLLPALITCERGLNEPRYASLPGIMKAKKKEVKEVTPDKINVEALGLTKEALGQAGARFKITKLEVPQVQRRLKIIKGAETQEAAHELVKLLREEAKVI